MQYISKRYYEIILFLCIFTAGTVFYQPVHYDNARSRLMLLSAIVDYNTFSIDALQRIPHLFSIDVSKHNGRYYSAKAPGAPMIAAPVYWLIKQFYPQKLNNLFHNKVLYLVMVFTNGLIFGFLGVVLWRFGVMLSGVPRDSTLMVVAFSFGTIAWIHSQQFSGHLMAGGLCFFGFMALFYVRYSLLRKNKTPSFHFVCVALLGGLLTGLGAICDFTAMYLALLLTLYAVWSRLPINTIATFILGGSFSVFLLGFYNFQCFGSVFSLSYQYLIDNEFASGAAKGLLGISAPTPHSLYMLLFSPSRGLFFLMPILVFSIVGLTNMSRIKSLRNEMFLISFAAVGYLFINAGFYGWHGGWTYGPRYMSPMLPFLALPLVFGPVRSVSFSAILILSILLVIPGVLVMPHTPQEAKNPIFEIIIPLFKRGYVPLSWFNYLGIGKYASLFVGTIVICLAIGIIIFLSRYIAVEKNEPAWSVPRPISTKFLPVVAACIWAYVFICLAFVRTPEPDGKFLPVMNEKLYINYNWQIQP